MHKACQTDDGALSLAGKRIAALEVEVETLKGVLQFHERLPEGDVLPLPLSPDIGVVARSATARLAVDLTPHDVLHKGTGNECMAVAADKSIEATLCLVAANGTPLEPREGLRIRAALHVEGDVEPLDATSIVPCQRAGKVRRMEPLLIVSRGTSGVFDFDTPEVQLTMRIGVYSSEVRHRKLAVRFSVVDDGGAAATGSGPPIAPACSMPLYVMSRTPNSRKASATPKRPRAEAPSASAVVDELVLAETVVAADAEAARIAHELFGQIVQ